MRAAPQSYEAIQKFKEAYTVEDIVSIFRKAIALKESGFLPNFEEIQESLDIFLSHVRILDANYYSFVQSTLNKYGNVVMKKEENFIGLQGYIRYVEKYIIEPIELQIKIEKWEAEGIGVMERHIFIRKKLEKDIIIKKTALEKIEKIQENIANILKKPTLWFIKWFLERKNEQCNKLLKNTQGEIQKLEQELERFTTKKD